VTLTASEIQNQTLSLLPQVQKTIADLQHKNYHIPTLAHGERILIQRDRELPASGEYIFAEADYVDGREELDYEVTDLPLRNISDAAEIQRLARLNRLLDRLVTGSSIATAQLKSALTPQQYAEYLESTTAPQHFSELLYGDGMPSELRDYNRKLKAADFQKAKYEKMASMESSGRAKYRYGVVRRASDKAEHLYEAALERLSEIWGVASPAEQQTLQHWMDREIDLDAGPDSKLGIDVDSIPRVRGSKSRNALDSGLPKLNQSLKRRECQLAAVCAAASGLAFEAAEEPVMSEENLKQLRARLKKMRDSWDDRG
jgi:hypothetical protein